MKEDRDAEFDFFGIDLTKLEQEWAEQPKLMFHWSSQVADASLRWEEAKSEIEVSKSELELTVAQLDSVIRERPDQFGINGRPTEKSIETIVIQQDEYQEGLRKIQKWKRIAAKRKHRVDVLGAAVSALVDRKKALEKTVDLHGQQYWSVPQVKTRRKHDD